MEVRQITNNPAVAQNASQQKRVEVNGVDKQRQPDSQQSTARSGRSEQDSPAAVVRVESSASVAKQDNIAAVAGEANNLNELLGQIERGSLGPATGNDTASNSAEALSGFDTEGLTTVSNTAPEIGPKSNEDSNSSAELNSKIETTA